MAACSCDVMKFWPTAGPVANSVYVQASLLDLSFVVDVSIGAGGSEGLLDS